jgi:hypothetical protein
VQPTQVRAAGRASSRPPGIGSWQTSHVPYERGVDLGEVVVRLRHQRAHLRALERDGGALGVVLVVGVRVPGRGDHPVVVRDQGVEPPLRPVSLRVEQCPPLHHGAHRALSRDL